ncbi:MAG: Ca-activated chloride channel family protein [Gammaproteobacteria bacterium]|jgi:Ca-activated chloride channel family protein
MNQLLKFGTSCFLVIGLVVSPLLSAQNESSNRPLYIIFDGSNSMWGELPDKSRKIAVAKEVFNDLDVALFKDREVALRIYGHRRAGDCSDMELVVPFAFGGNSLELISTQVNDVSPRGRHQYRAV